MSDAADVDLDLVQVLLWAEFCAWSALAMAPIIWWLQGPSVSTDQFVVRTGLIVISVCTAVGIRGWAIVQRRRAAKAVTAGEPSDQRPEQQT